MDTFEIKDDDVNVLEIMKQIRENIRKRDHKNVTNSCHDLQSSTNGFSSNNSQIDNELDNLKMYCDINNDTYTIDSHRPVIGNGLVKGRRLVNDEVRRYVDPMIFKQSNFNNNVLKIFIEISYLFKKIENLESAIFTSEDRLSQLENLEYKIDDLKETVKTDKHNTDELLNVIKSDIVSYIDQLKTDINKDFDTRFTSYITSIEEDMHKKSWLAQALKQKIDDSINDLSIKYSNLETKAKSEINYLEFENKFRGPSEQISKQQNAFLQYFEGCHNVLDIGCGRGEFIELLNSHNIDSYGIDIDENMVEYCSSKGLNVHLEDAIVHLSKTPDDSLDGIFIDQVVEHLEPNYLITLLKMCHKKLKTNSYLIAETVNPLSFFSFANFYIDFTHIKPVHPETLKFLFTSAGFNYITSIFSSPVSQDNKLSKMIVREGINEIDKYQIQIYNENIEKLNSTLYGPQDYAIIGKK